VTIETVPIALLLLEVLAFLQHPGDVVTGQKRVQERKS